MTRRRPLVISIICIIGFVGGISAIPMAFSAQAVTISHMYPPFLLLSAAIGLVCFAGLWKMKRWSVIAYTVLAGVSQVTLFALGTWSITALVVPGLIIAMSLAYYASMEPFPSRSAL